MSHIVDKVQSVALPDRNPVRPYKQSFAPTAHKRAIGFEDEYRNVRSRENVNEIPRVHRDADCLDQPGFVRDIRPTRHRFKRE